VFCDSRQDAAHHARFIEGVEGHLRLRRVVYSVLKADEEMGKLARIIQCAVKRRRSSVGEIPTRQLVAPAGSNRSGHGGNEMAEALRCRGSPWATWRACRP
jgi:hypothetical protein